MTKVLFLAVLFFLPYKPAHAVSELVGRWIPVSGDFTWARLEINRELVVTAYRSCSSPSTCEGQKRFRLTSYGRSKLFAPVHNIGSGHIADKNLGVKATEVLEIRGDQLLLNEYIVSEPKPGARNTVLRSVFKRAPTRLR